MKIISHRGNLDGPDPKYENTIGRIDYAISKGFDVEIDVWKVPGEDFYFLGHDKPMTWQTVPQWFLEQKELWVHAKNVETLLHLQTLGTVNVFWQVDSKINMTWKRKLWLNSSCTPRDFSKKSVYVFLEERKEFNDLWIDHLYGVCTDYPLQFEDLQCHK